MIRLPAAAPLAAALLQSLIPALPALGVGQSIGHSAAAEGPMPELPPGAFFSIWGVIFALFLGIGVWIWRQRREDDLTLALTVAALGNSLWMLLAQGLESRPLNTLLILPLLGAALWLLRLWSEERAALPLALAALSGLFAGWLIVASAISLTMMARVAFGAFDPLPSQLLAVAALALAGGTALIVRARLAANPWLNLALGWGLIGVALTSGLGLRFWPVAGLAVLAAILALAHPTRLLARRLRQALDQRSAIAAATPAMVRPEA